MTGSHLVDRVVVHTQDHALVVRLAVELLHGLESALRDGDEGAGGGILGGRMRTTTTATGGGGG